MPDDEVEELIRKLGYAYGGIFHTPAERPVEAFFRSLPLYKREVVATLVKIGAPAVEPLCRALGNADIYIRFGAADTLGEIGDARAVEPLCKALGAESIYLRCHAAEALGKIGDARAVEPLCILFRDMGGPPLRKYLNFDIGIVRRYAAMALREIGDCEILLRKILLCSSMDLRARASTLNTLSSKGKYFQDSPFGLYNPPDAQRYCEEMVSNADLELREAAEEMLRFLLLLRPSHRNRSAEGEELLRAESRERSSDSGDELL